MENNMTPLSLNDTFKFSCSKKVPCFNECCRDLNQFLFPYDILRMKNRLGLPSNLFLEQYTSQHTGPETGLPVITFKTDPFKELKAAGQSYAFRSDFPRFGRFWEVFFLQFLTQKKSFLRQLPSGVLRQKMFQSLILRSRT